jgi:plasmid stabilization system protein ParE
VRLEWSAWAQADRDAIFNHIEADNPRAAVTVDMRISDRSSGLAGFQGVVALAASKAHASWSSPARRISSRIALSVIPCAFSAFWTARGHGPTICLTDNQSVPSPLCKPAPPTVQGFVGRRDV